MTIWQSSVYDIDPLETEEWVEGLREVIDAKGLPRAEYLLDTLNRAAGMAGVRGGLGPYVNTISPEDEGSYPGDEAIESKLEALVRWNAAVMVHRANVSHGLGGHIGTYASASTVLEVALNWHIRGGAKEADSVFYQPHASPGIYARSFLEGRISENQMDRFRRELGGGLPSYPHPRSMPAYWEHPTASMGLGLLNAIHQARFERYLQSRGLSQKDDRKVWAFVGDGEMAEPEASTSIRRAGREGLGNLTVIVNCNLQQLDGPVQGDGKIIEELAEQFGPAGWTVLKVLWGRELDPIFGSRRGEAVVSWLTQLTDGALQGLTASEIQRRLGLEFPNGLPRGGHDRRKMNAALTAAADSTQPTVILAHTVKGFGLGPSLEARNAIHQVKTLTPEGLRNLRDRLELDIPDRELADGLPPYLHPGPNASEIEYLRTRRNELGGTIPSRTVSYQPIRVKSAKPFDAARRGYGNHVMATTRVMIRLLRDIMKDEHIGPRIVPIVPDEARTFGLDGLFRSHKIYEPGGQTYQPVDSDHLLAYVEAPDGQILHEGINEAASMASFHAAGSSYATNGEPMFPFYFFYSMFGFQRTGDLMWSAADQRCRGFLIGATAGGTTLNGEGLQHQDRHSPLLASTNPAVKTYDPAFAYELAVIVQRGFESLAAGGPKRDEDLIYYLTVYNEAVQHPPQPDHVTDEDILAGLYALAPARSEKSVASVLASGVIVLQALVAQSLLAHQGIDVDVWSVPSWVELHREGLRADASGVRSHIDVKLGSAAAPFIAASDWMPAIPLLISPWVPGPMRAIGPSGFGMSDSRASLRAHFNVDAVGIALTVLAELEKQGELEDGDQMAREIEASRA